MNKLIAALAVTSSLFAGLASAAEAAPTPAAAPLTSTAAAAPAAKTVSTPAKKVTHKKHAHVAKKATTTAPAAEAKKPA